MKRPKANKSEFESYYRKCRGIITEYGHMIQYVVGDNDTSFAYTVGVEPQHGYELAVSGISYEESAWMLNMCVAKMSTENIVPGKNVALTGLTDSSKVIFYLRRASPAMSMGVWTGIYRRPKPEVWQVMWPDNEMRHTEDENYNHVDFRQPYL